jgi:hypothetical protein
VQPKVRSEGVVQFDEFKCCDPHPGFPIERWKKCKERNMGKNAKTKVERKKG